nr:outer membrane lipoprotein chaperone LolA [Neptunicella marina]
MLISGTASAESAKQQLQSKLSALKSYSAVFAQTVIDAKGQVLQQATGKIRLLQPNKLFWEVDEPNENVLIADGISLWHVDPFVEQVVAMDQLAAVSNNPIVLLAQPDSKAWDEYSIAANESGDKFTVSTSSESSQIEQLVFVFDGKTLKALDIIDRQQQTTQLIFDDIKQGAPISTAIFKFSLPDGYTLDDQRNVAAGD